MSINRATKKLLQEGTKALSVRQPWAWAIFHAGKDVENRPSGFARRIAPQVLGKRIFIHASKTRSRSEHEEIAEAVWEDYGIKVPPYEKMELGGLIGSVRFLELIFKSKSAWFGGEAAFTLADPITCSFVPVRGQLGLFRPKPLVGDY